MKNLFRNRTFVVTLTMAVVLLAGFLVGRASAAQPHMRAALDHLISAKTELQVAARDKGGHRVKALGLVNDAIAEVRLGIDVGAE
jgi:hypothetical protein